MDLYLDASDFFLRLRRDALRVGCRYASIRSLRGTKRIFLGHAQTDADDRWQASIVGSEWSRLLRLPLPTETGCGRGVS